MPRASSIVRSVHFADEVHRAIDTPEGPISVASSYAVPSNPGQYLVQDSSGLAVYKDYRDGIHAELREPSVIFDLDGHVDLVGLFDKSILNAPATESYAPFFFIGSHSFPWKITISPQDGSVTTVQDVLYGIVNDLQRPAAHEFAELRRADPHQYGEVEGRRRRRVEEGSLTDTSARWIDWLPPRERKFVGLSSEQGSFADSTERILKVQK